MRAKTYLGMREISYLEIFNACLTNQGKAPVGGITGNIALNHRWNFDLDRKHRRWFHASRLSLARGACQTTAQAVTLGMIAPHTKLK